MYNNCPRDKQSENSVNKTAPLQNKVTRENVKKLHGWCQHHANIWDNNSALNNSKQSFAGRLVLYDTHTHTVPECSTLACVLCEVKVEPASKELNNVTTVGKISSQVWSKTYQVRS